MHHRHSSQSWYVYEILMQIYDFGLLCKNVYWILLILFLFEPIQMWTGGGFLIGSVVSLLFFKRRAFPLWIGTGFGFGVGYRNCETALNSKEKF